MSAPKAERSEGTSGTPYGSPAYCWYVLGVLTLVYALHALDRGLPNILIEPVRHEFGLTDSQLGLFSGLAYGLSFAATVLPIGYLSDRMNRRKLLAAVVLLWSLLTAFSGMSRSFGQLVLARVGVGASEAGAAPLAIPMVVDIFPSKRRALALGVFWTGPPLGGFVAAALGGYIAAEHGWRAAFFLAGIPGILVALLLLFTVREPRRGATDPEAAPSADPPPRFTEAVAFLIRTPALICLIGTVATLSLLSIAMGAWMGSFFIRIHGLTLAQTGLVLGVGGGLCSCIAPALFGWAADKLAVRDPRWPLRLVMISGLLALLLTQVTLFASSVAVAIVGFILADFVRMGFAPPTISVLMTHTPARVRGGVMSILQLASAVIGFGLGPLLTGMLSDYLGGGAAIKYALVCVSLLFVVAAALLMLASHLLFGPANRRQPASNGAGDG